MQDIIQQLGPGESVNAPMAGTIIAYKAETSGLPLDVIVNGATRRLNVGDVSELPAGLGDRLRMYNPNSSTIHVRYFIGSDMYYAAQVAGTVAVKGGVAINGQPIKTLVQNDTSNPVYVVDAQLNAMSYNYKILGDGTDNFNWAYNYPRKRLDIHSLEFGNSQAQLRIYDYTTNSQPLIMTLKQGETFTLYGPNHLKVFAWDTSGSQSTSAIMTGIEYTYQ